MEWWLRCCIPWSRTFSKARWLCAESLRQLQRTIALTASVAWSLGDEVELLVLIRREECFVDASCSRVGFVLRLALGGPIVAAAIGPLLVLFAPYRIRCIGLSGLS